MAVGGKVPVWYWIVVVLALAWAAFGCFDFTMTGARDPAYLAAFPADYVAYLDTFPLWLMGCWALGVWGALAGSFLLLVRLRAASLAFAISLAGLLVTTLFQAFDGARPATLRIGVAEVVLSSLIWAVAVALFVFSLRMRARGLLR